MKINFKAFVILSFLSCASCTKYDLTIKVINSSSLGNIHSASGIQYSDSKKYIVGDDIPYLYILDDTNQKLDSILLFDYDTLINGRIPKNIKPDFEAIELNHKNEIIVLSSGSEKKTRSILTRVIFEEDSVQIKKYDTKNLLKKLEKKYNYPSIHTNFEGLAFIDNDIVLLNRDNNMAFQMSYKKFIKFLRKNKKLPKTKQFEYELPSINGIESGFSGATYLKEKNILIFTSSVEDKSGNYNDGEILGSFIGVIQCNDNKLTEDIYTVRIPDIVENLKVESVTVKKVEKDNITLDLVTDSDGGESHIIEVKLTL